MTQQTEVEQQNRQIQLPAPNDEEQVSLSNLHINVVIGVLTLVAFLPAFLDREFYTSPSRLFLSLMLGLAYLGIAVWGTIWHEKRLSLYSATVYFGVQMLIAFGLIFLGDGIRHNFWLLLLPLSGQGLSMGSWRGGALVSLISLLLYTGLILLLNRNQIDANLWQNVLNIITSIGSAMFFVILFTFIAIREGETREEISMLATELKEANHRLAEYAAQVEELATTRERNRLAREIHDNLGHYLTVINVQLEAARALLPNDTAKSEDSLIKAQRLAQEGLSSVRESVSALRESPIGGRSLTEAITQLAEEMRSAGTAVSFKVVGSERPLGPKTGLTLYRAAQEGLTNVRKHANASNVVVLLDFSNPHTIQLILKDDGIGSDNPEGGFGLLGLRERIQLLDGTVDIDTQADQGFKLHVILPGEEKP